MELEEHKRIAEDILARIEGYMPLDEDAKSREERIKDGEEIDPDEYEDEDSEYTIEEWDYTPGQWLNEDILDIKPIEDEDGEVIGYDLLRMTGGPQCNVRVYSDKSVEVECFGWFGKDSYVARGEDKIGLTDWLFY